MKSTNTVLLLICRAIVAAPVSAFTSEPSFYPSVGLDVIAEQYRESLIQERVSLRSNSSSTSLVLESTLEFSNNSNITVTPSTTPSATPSSTPSVTPSATPSVSPSVTPSSTPSISPSVTPSSSPTKTPSSEPSLFHSSIPSTIPTIYPTVTPSATPSTNPSLWPTGKPTTSPSTLPTSRPTSTPSTTPSTMPSNTPSKTPSSHPSLMHSSIPSTMPSMSPTAFPSQRPSQAPSNVPSTIPSGAPTLHPSLTPSLLPSVLPTNVPTSFPSDIPTKFPTLTPTTSPSQTPSVRPTTTPSAFPSSSPSFLPTQHAVEQVTKTSVRLYNIQEYLSNSDSLPIFESVTKTFINSYDDENLPSSKIEIDDVVVQSQALGPGYLSVYFVIYGHLSPSSNAESNNIIFQQAALNGFIHHYSDYEMRLKNAHEFFEDLYILEGISFLDEELSDDDNNNDSSFLSITSKSMTVIIVVGIVMIVLAFATIRYSRKDIVGKKWPKEDIEQGNLQGPTHCLADDTINIEGGSVSDNDSEVPYGIDLSPETLQDMYSKRKNMDEGRSVTFAPEVKAITEGENTSQSEPLSDNTNKNNPQRLKDNNKNISTNKLDHNSESTQNNRHAEIVTNAVHDDNKHPDDTSNDQKTSRDDPKQTYKDSGFENEPAAIEINIDELDDLVGSKCKGEFMTSPMPTTKILNRKEREDIHNEMIKSKVQSNDEHPDEKIGTSISQTESKGIDSFDTKDRNQISEMLGTQYNPTIVAPVEQSNSEWSDAIKLGPSADSSNEMDVIPTMSSITDVDFNRTPIRELRKENKDKGVELFIVCKAPAGPLGLIIGSTSRGPIVQLIKASSPLIGQIHIGDIIVRVDEIETQHMSSAALTRVMAARRNQQERKLLLVRR